jgi:RNA polymerase sigma-70 factor (ECF subfamily)
MPEHSLSPQADLSSTALWTSFRDGLSGYVSRRVSVPQDAEDILQDIFIRIHTGMDTIKESDKVRSWVFGVAHRAIADHYRKVYRAPGRTAIDQESEENLGSEELAFSIETYEGDHNVHEEVLSWLRPMISRLPEPYAEVLRRSDVEGQSQTRMAEELGVSYSAVKSRVQRARKMLGEVLGDCCEVEFGEDGKVVEFRERSRHC